MHDLAISRYINVSGRFQKDGLSPGTKHSSPHELQYISPSVFNTSLGVCLINLWNRSYLAPLFNNGPSIVFAQL